MSKFFTSRITLLSLLLLFVVATAILGATVQHYRQTPKPIVVDCEALRQKLNTPPPPWMLERIKTDLAPFVKRGISRSMIDALFQGKTINQYSLIRFSIQNRRLFFSLNEKQLDTRHFRHLLASIKKLNELVELPDVDFVLSLEDGFDCNPSGFPVAPCFVFAKSENTNNFILMPDFKALGGYGKLRQQILDANERFPWESKATKAFWRGSTTSGFFQGENWNQFCRGKLVLLSLDAPAALDARFTSVVQCTPEVPELMRKKGMLSLTVDKAKHLKYKYLVDVDGNSCTYERCFWLLLSNSLLFKQITPNVQWYYGGLKPYVHFVPIREDLSNLLEQIQWAKAHDLEAKKIAEESTTFVQENLSTESIFQYMALLLTEYAKLQADSQKL